MSTMQIVVRNEVMPVPMMNPVSFFENSEFGQMLRILKDATGDLRFIAKDVCEALDLTWSGTRIAHVPEEWKGVTSVVTPGGTQDMAYLTEQGLYFFLGRSDKPKALPYQKWIAGEVMPSIRKTGTYSLPNFNDPIAAAEAWIAAEKSRLAAEHIAIDAIRTKAEIGSRREATSMATASTATRKAEALSDQLGIGRHYRQVKAIEWLQEEFESSAAMYSQVGKKLSELSKRMGIPPRNVPDERYPGGVKSYHVDVIEAFRLQLLTDRNMLWSYRRR